MIANHVYALIDGLAVTWRQANGSADGLGVISVPPQQDDLKPFIISKVVEDGAYLKESVIGYRDLQPLAREWITKCAAAR
jgi:hypothetical protein